MFNVSDNMTFDLLQLTPPAWVSVFDNVQLTVSIIGVISNLATLITLGVNGEGISKIIRMLFQYQALLDCMVCLNAALLFYPPPMWVVGNEVVDTIICHVLHSQFLYWLLVLYSIRNLVTQAVERYLCICHPLRYMTLTRRHFRLPIAGMVLLDTLVTVPLLLHGRMRDGFCRFEPLWEGPVTEKFFQFYAYFSFLNVHVIPATLLVVLYGLVLLTLSKRANMNLGASGAAGVIDKAKKELTKTVIVVTVFFIASTCVSQWHYILMYSGVLEFHYYSLLQKTDELLSVTNFVANPFIYASFMPIYRESIKKTLFGHCTSGN